MLKGGRLSIAEPINRDFGQQSIPETADLQAIMKAKDDIEEDPATNPMLNFTERDLLAMAHEVGFAKVHLDLCIDLEPREPMDWETYLNVTRR